MKHIQTIFDSIARILYKPYNAATAAMDHFDAIRTHGDEALKDWDEVKDIIREYEELKLENYTLETENAEMRRMLRDKGIIYKGKEEAA